MTDITLTLDHHEFYFAVRGFINGSHLSQDVFETIIFPSIRQMDDEFQNYLWWILRRNHFDQYLRKEEDGFKTDACGAKKMDEFITKAGRKATYLSFDAHTNKHILCVAGNYVNYNYYPNGKCEVTSYFDIVSKKD